MDSNYLDFGSSSDSDGDGAEGMEGMDSDEEEMHENNALLKMMNMSSSTSKKSRNIDDFEAEMEAELDKRALEVENEGGMEHQKSLSRSSSSSSLNVNAVPAIKPALSGSGGLSVGIQGKKSVKFADSSTSVSVIPSVATVDGTTNNESEEEKKELYDPIYFDSDESEGEDDDAKKKKRTKRTLLSNDDLLYDPDSDAKDQAWVDNKRRKYIRTSKSVAESKGGQGTSKASGSKKKSVPLPSTDAVLNCPACFSVLCLDCQRHEFYTGQYRAMFVMNCLIDKTETLIVPLKEPKSKGRRGKNKSNYTEESLFNPPTNSGGNSADTFNPVKCKICSTQVAVYDIEEVYHFFNVLASHP